MARNRGCRPAEEEKGRHLPLMKKFYNDKVAWPNPEVCMKNFLQLTWLYYDEQFGRRTKAFLLSTKAVLNIFLNNESQEYQITAQNNVVDEWTNVIEWSSYINYKGLP